MSKIKGIVVISILMIFSVAACKFPVTDYVQIQGKSYLTVDAELSNQVGPYRVTLSYSSAKIDATGYVTPILKALVYITDENKIRTNYVEGSKGTYTTSPDFRARVGGTYTLHIETSDGKIYESTPEKIVEKTPKIDSVYYDKGEVLVNFKDSDTPNEYYNWTWKHYEPIYYCQVCSGGQWNFFFNQCIVNPKIPSETIYKYACDSKCWEFYSGKSINIFSDKLYNGKQITGLSVAKITAFKRYYFALDTYYISETYYNFLKSLKSQIEENGTLFDVPTLTKFNFNIRNINDASEQTLGIFRVYSSSRKIVYLDGIGTYAQFVSPNAIDENPPISVPCEEGASRTKIAPEGWKD